MVGSLIIRGLVLILVYVYPAFEFFKTVEMNEPDIEQLLFWCQYWILLVGLTVCEHIAHRLINWVPMFNEAKLAFFIYLWFHKTKGTRYVYESFFRPCVSKHVKMIDHLILKLKTRALFYWNIRLKTRAFFYWQKASSYGQTKIDEILQYLGSQSTPPPQRSSLVAVAGSSSSELQEDATEQAAFNPASKRKAKPHETFIALKGGRRTVWCALALCSFLVALFILEEASFAFKEWLIQQVERVIILKGDDWENLPNAIIMANAHLYVFFILCLAYPYQIPPIKLPCFARWFFEILFFLICLALACYVEDFWGMVYGFVVCFHFIPLINILGAFENFSLLDCLLALVFEVGLCISKDPKYPPYVIVIISAAFQVMRHCYEHSEGKRREEHLLEKGKGKTI